ncbi:MAG: hypothetical protein FK734_04270 [Asgard group archaeon]|nr:hypothetical protein [Asgard group archaeon]
MTNKKGRIFFCYLILNLIFISTMNDSLLGALTERESINKKDDIVCLKDNLTNSLEDYQVNPNNIKKASEENYELAEKITSSYFIENNGQFSKNINYYAKLENGFVYFSESKITFQFKAGTFNIDFIGANTVKPVGNNYLNSYSNFYLSEKSITNVKHCSQIIFKNLYNGITLIYKFTPKGLKYDFIIEPYANTDQIIISYSGLDSLKIDFDKLVYTIDGLSISDKDLIAWYDDNHEKIGIQYQNYNTHSSTKVQFKFVQNIDPSRRIVIDPLICTYSTFIGGSGDEYKSDIVDIGEANMDIDNAGNIIIAGRTNSINLPLENATQTSNAGNYDGFIVKLSADGQTLIFATYLGGSSSEWIADLAVDNSGNIAVIGTTYSPNFPILNALQESFNGGTTFNIDPFVAKFNSTGGLLFSTYWGGTEGDWGYGIAFDHTGKILVTGDTYSDDFFTLNAHQNTYSSGSSVDAIITKFTADGQSVVFSTYLGSTGNDWGTDIVADADDNIIVVGGTLSGSFPTLNPYQSTVSDMAAIVLKFTPAGVLTYSSTLDGMSTDRAYACTVDSNNNIVVVGSTVSNNFPLANATFGYKSGIEAYVTILTPDGQALEYSSYLSGMGGEEALDVAVDSDDNIVVTGITSSADFPIKHSFQYSYNGSTDCFITKIATNWTLICSSFLGSSAKDIGLAVAVDSTDRIIIGGATYSVNYPTVNALQDSLSGTTDMVISIFELDLTLPDYTPTPTPSPSPSPTEVSGLPLTITIDILSIISCILVIIRKRKK